LQEELGITNLKAALWRTELVDYPHALVRLNFCKVSKWRGELQMREAQQFAWQRLPVQCVPVLPGTVPVLMWLAQEQGFLGATHSVA
jgi:8-oxo-dGTP diphosphatase